ncbi:MAG: peptide-binding protein [Zetaproteobacteria bacterium CG2_30_46_52]|nr:MAG: peptide-binding protein [Zetaproteobacteria bacterium CG2_30_46_52]
MDYRSFTAQFVSLSLCFTLFACNSEQPQTNNTPAASSVSNLPSHGGRMLESSIGDASNLIPMIAGDAASHDVASNLYLSLLKYDRDLNLVGQLAESWKISEDKLSITFTLKPNLKWSDNHPFTAEDCLFTLHLIQADSTQSPYKSDYTLVSKATAQDARTFTVTYNEIFSPALASWASLAILPKHIFEGQDIMNTSLSRSPKVSIGPYFLKDWQAQQSITMQANPHYFDGDVWIDTRITRIIPDPATQFLELSAGKIDMMNLTPTQYSRLFEKNKKLMAEYERYKYLGFTYTYLGFNLKRGPFTQPEVRQAIAYAIDRQELVDGVLLGLGEPLAAPFKPGTTWVNNKIKPRAYDPALARKLLAQVGYTEVDGKMVKNGEALAFTILTNNGNKMRADTATIVQQRLREIGITVNVRLVEWSAFIENFINTRDFDAVILGWSLSPEPDQYNIWHSSQTGARQFNFLSYANAKVDKALDEARKTFDVDQRKAWYDMMQEEIHHDAPLVFLYAGYSLPAIHKRIYGIDPAPSGIGHNREQWFIPKALQQQSIAP